MTLRLAGLDLTLLPQRAVWIASLHTLVLSDLHLGKSATFRTHGIPVPEGETRADLARLSALVATMDARHLVIAGDLVHAAAGLVPPILAQLTDFLHHCPAEVLLVEGNHDRTARLHQHGLDLHITPHHQLGRLTVIHDPADLREPTAAICGHLHPAVRLPLSPRRQQRRACFFLRESILALPGFGSFTGTHLVERQPTDRLFIPLTDQVLEI